VIHYGIVVDCDGEEECAVTLTTTIPRSVQPAQFKQFVDETLGNAGWARRGQHTYCPTCDGRAQRKLRKARLEELTQDKRLSTKEGT
jgi:hypothetical protein